MFYLVDVGLIPWSLSYVTNETGRASMTNFFWKHFWKMILQDIILSSYIM